MGYLFLLVILTIYIVSMSMLIFKRRSSEYPYRKLINKEVALVVSAGNNRVVYRGVLQQVYSSKIVLLEIVNIPDEEDTKKLKKGDIKQEEVKYETFKQLHVVDKSFILSLTIPVEEK